LIVNGCIYLDELSLLAGCLDENNRFLGESDLFNGDTGLLAPTGTGTAIAVVGCFLACTALDGNITAFENNSAGK
jgi:hypothetical protein